MMSGLVSDRNRLPSTFCSLNDSTSVAHSLMPRKLETSSASHVAGSRLPPLRERGVVPLESTRRGITFGAAGAAAGGADAEEAAFVS